MIIHYNYDPRCTRRARPGVLLKGCPLVWYHAPVGRWAVYARAYVVPRNPRTPPQVRMRHLFGALAKDWFARLTQPQRDAWNLYARRIHRRWRPGRRTLTGQQAYVKLNSSIDKWDRAVIFAPI